MTERAPTARHRLRLLLFDGMGFRQIRPNQIRGFNELSGGNLHPLPALCISAGIVRCPSLTAGAVECGELRRAYAPITSLLPGHDVEMEVRGFLPAEDSVVLKRKYPEGAIGFDQRLGDSLGRDHDRAAFLGGKIEQCRDVPARDDAALAYLELPGIDYGERMFAFVHDRPSFFAAGHPFAQVARLSYG